MLAFLEERRRKWGPSNGFAYPSLIIMDETDSGLDVDALKTTADAINKLRNDKRSFIIITHYLRVLEYIEPDYVHVFQNGSVIESGDKTLASRIDQEGYS